MTDYRHTQTGTLTRTALGSAIVLQLVIVLAARGNVAVLLICGSVTFLAAGCLYVFHSMTVTVGDREVAFRFGNSRFGKQFPIDELKRAEAVRNPWYFGWGVRYYLRGWLYNVSGLDAVELTMADGRQYRLGTDDPKRLATAINRRRASTRASGTLWSVPSRN